MSIHKQAGLKPTRDMLVNVPRLMQAYYTRRPDPGQAGHAIAFGTSGHRGSSLKHSFNQDHILAVTQAICEHRSAKGVNGPLFMGKDTHALSEAAFGTALEVLAANGVETVIQEGLGYTPTPVISHAILTANADRGRFRADGIVITPSHNPPEDGGIKYNPPEGGPADTKTTAAIQDRANEILRTGVDAVARVPLERALKAATTHFRDFRIAFVQDLRNVLNMGAIASSGLKIGVDPLGGSGIDYWDMIAETYGLDIEVVNRAVDPTFAFMPVDRDGKIRMDCSSAYAMTGLIALKERFDIAWGNDPDYDRHGIVTRTGGLMNPNHYLAVAVEHLFSTREQWSPELGVGKTAVTSAMLDRVAGSLNRRVVEVPVGFKWFVPGLLQAEIGFGGEESAGASFLRFDSGPWSTDKDGLIMDLLAAEITALRGKDPAELFTGLEARFGRSEYARIDAPATPEQKALLKKLAPEDLQATELAGETIQAALTAAPGNNAPIGGLKVVTDNGWFAARPSGTEDIYKIYAESFKGREHLDLILKEAQDLVDSILTGGRQ